MKEQRDELLEALKEADRRLVGLERWVETGDLESYINEQRTRREAIEKAEAPNE